MEKLELKHLAPYLPYGLMVLFGNYKMKMTAEIQGASHYSIEGVIDDKKVKPILRPLSDLTKAIQINGERCYPIYKLAEWLFNEEPESFNNVEKAKDWINANISLESREYLNLPYKIVIKLFEWHFDLFGLIPKELAIDINAL